MCILLPLKSKCLISKSYFSLETLVFMTSYHTVLILAIVFQEPFLV